MGTQEWIQDNWDNTDLWPFSEYLSYLLLSPWVGSPPGEVSDFLTGHQEPDWCNLEVRALWCKHWAVLSMGLWENEADKFLPNFLFCRTCPGMVSTWNMVREAPHTWRIHFMKYLLCHFIVCYKDGTNKVMHCIKYLISFLASCSFDPRPHHSGLALLK